MSIYWVILVPFMTLAAGVGIIAGLGLLRTRFERLASWGLLCALCGAIALRQNGAGIGDMQFGVLAGSLLMLFWQPGWMLGRRLRHRHPRT